MTDQQRSRAGAHRRYVGGHATPTALGERIAHFTAEGCVHRRNIHAGAGAIDYMTLLDGSNFLSNILFVHRGILPPGGGIGHHFHHDCEEMYLIFDNEAEFTIDGRTSLLRGPVGVPCRMGHSHGIYNASARPTQWMNINVTKTKGVYDTFDLNDDCVGANLDTRPVFMAIDLRDPGDPNGNQLGLTRLIAPGLFAGPWRSVDRVCVRAGAIYAHRSPPNEEAFAYVLEGSGTVEASAERGVIGAGDAVALVGDADYSFKADSAGRLMLMVVGVEIG